MDPIYDFNTFVTELVKYQLLNKSGFTYEKVAEKMNVSHSFFRQVMSSNEKHFNLRHIFLISQILEEPIDKFIPSIENYQLLRGYALTEEEWQEIIKNAKNYREDSDV